MKRKPYRYLYIYWIFVTFPGLALIKNDLSGQSSPLQWYHLLDKSTVHPEVTVRRTRDWGTFISKHVTTIAEKIFETM